MLTLRIPHPNSIKLKMPSLTQIRHLFLYAIIVTLPLDNWTALHILPSVTLNRVCGLIYIALALLTPNRLFGFNKQSRPAIALLALWGVLLLSGLINTFRYGYEINLSTNYLSMALIFWLFSNEIYLRPEIRNRILIIFSSTVFAMYLSLQAGYGAQASRDLDSAVDSLDMLTRVWFFGLNPNSLGNYGALALLFIVFLVFSPDNKSPRKYLPLLTLPFYIHLVGISGSAGAFLVLFLGLFTFFTLRRVHFIRKV